MGNFALNNDLILPAAIAMGSDGTAAPASAGAHAISFNKERRDVAMRRNSLQVSSQPARYLRFSSASESGTLVIFMFAPS